MVYYSDTVQCTYVRTQELWWHRRVQAGFDGICIIVIYGSCGGKEEFKQVMMVYSRLGIRSFQKNATFLRSFPLFIKECGVICVLFRSL